MPAREPRHSSAGPARRCGRGRIAGAWLAVFALALHALVPLAQGVPGPRGEAGRPASPFLCVAFGTNAEPAQQGRVPTEDERRSCPICQINALVTSFVPVFATVSQPAADRTAEWWPRAANDAVGASPRSCQARGPPATA